MPYRYALTSPAVVVIAERFARRAFWEEAARAGCWDSTADEVHAATLDRFIQSSLEADGYDEPDQRCNAAQGRPRWVCLAELNQLLAQVDVDYSDADKRTVLRFFAALAALVSRQPPARSTSGIDGVLAERQVLEFDCSSS